PKSGTAASAQCASYFLRFVSSSSSFFLREFSNTQQKQLIASLPECKPPVGRLRKGEISLDRPIRRIAIVGTGVIGASWAAEFLAKGFDVVATDPAPDAEANLR